MESIHTHKVKYRCILLERDLKPKNKINLKKKKMMIGILRMKSKKQNRKLKLRKNKRPKREPNKKNRKRMKKIRSKIL